MSDLKYKNNTQLKKVSSYARRQENTWKQRAAAAEAELTIRVGLPTCECCIGLGYKWVSVNKTGREERWQCQECDGRGVSDGC